MLGDNGNPSPPFVTRIAPPASRMGTLTAAELAPHLQTEQVRHYSQAIDRRSAHELLSERLRPTPPTTERRRVPDPDLDHPSDRVDDGIDTDAYGEAPRPRARERQAPPPEESGWTDVLRSPVARSIASEVTRGLMGALLGRKPRRRRTSIF